MDSKKGVWIKFAFVAVVWMIMSSLCAAKDCPSICTSYKDLSACLFAQEQLVYPNLQCCFSCFEGGVYVVLGDVKSLRMKKLKKHLTVLKTIRFTKKTDSISGFVDSSLPALDYSFFVATKEEYKKINSSQPTLTLIESKLGSFFGSYAGRLRNMRISTSVDPDSQNVSIMVGSKLAKKSSYIAIQVATTNNLNRKIIYSGWIPVTGSSVKKGLSIKPVEPPVVIPLTVPVL